MVGATVADRRFGGGPAGAPGEGAPPYVRHARRAVRSLVDATARGPEPDERTPAQRRADALGELCRAYLDSSARPVVGGERPHLMLTVDRAPCTVGPGWPSSEEAGWISPQDVRRVACDAAVSRIITRGRSEPLELERQTAVVPTAVRRALILRDKRCPFPGSDRPHGWCDAHHVVALGRRRGELAFEPGAPVPKAPSGGSRGVRAPDDRRGAAVHAERRDDPQGSRRRTHVRIETTGVTLPRR